jgi:hypothetical protein
MLPDSGKTRIKTRYWARMRISIIIEISIELTGGEDTRASDRLSAPIIEYKIPDREKPNRNQLPEGVEYIILD